MDASHNFRFRWNDHVPHISQIFSKLRFDEMYCDTTLISEDGFVLKAHGAVLSATSRYFERVLSDVMTDQHPIIVLKGANFTELSCLLDYIYEGVTQVDQHLMESVLDVADMLEIKGLSKMKNNLSLKKLIAPSPPSSIVSRNSPQCSSPSKSPPPPCHTPRPHTPCSPSSPNEPYMPSTMMKMDSEDLANDPLDPSQKKRLSFHGSKGTPVTPNLENKDYPSHTTHSSAVGAANSEYSDETIGIDLSLSRPTTEEGDRVPPVRNFSPYEDTPLRKRKIMKYEELSPASNDFEWNKGGEKVEDSVPHKKKRFFSQADSTCDSEASVCDSLTQTTQQAPALFVDDSTMWQLGEQMSPGSESVRKFAPPEKGYSDRDNDDSFLFGEDDFYTDDGEEFDRRKMTASCSKSLDVSNVIRRPPSTAMGRQSSEEVNRPPRNIFMPCSTRDSHHLQNQSHASCSSGTRRNSDFSTTRTYNRLVWSQPGIIPVQKETPSFFSDLESTDSIDCEPPYGRNEGLSGSQIDVTDFVTIKISKNDPHSQVNSSPDPEPERTVQESLRVLETKLKRPRTEVKRPLTKYNFFMKEWYPKVARENPQMKAPEILRIVSSRWKNLTEEEKFPWEERANAYQKEFDARHPDYMFCPKTMQERKHEYKMMKVEKRNMCRVNPFIPYSRKHY